MRGRPPASRSKITARMALPRLDNHGQQPAAHPVCALADMVGAHGQGLFGRNIFNKYYWTTVEKQQDAVIRYAGKPATYGIQLSTRF